MFIKRHHSHFMTNNGFDNQSSSFHTKKVPDITVTSAKYLGLNMDQHLLWNDLIG